MSADLGAILDEIAPYVRAAPAARTVVIDDVEHDSRRVGRGMLFACVPGDTVDGHDFAFAAVDAGAAALLVQRPLTTDEPAIPQIVVDDVRAVMGRAADVVHDHPSRRVAVAGVTGTNGKTTTVHILAGLTRNLGGAATEIGTLTGARTTPEGPELQRALGAAADRGDDLVAMEVSSHALDQGRVDGTRFRVAGFTNLGIDHLDHHGTIEAYFAAKASLFDPERTDAAVIHTSTPYGARLVSMLEESHRATGVDLPVVAIGEHGAMVEELTVERSRFRWRDHLVDLPLGGRFNVANAVVAAEMAVVLGHRPGEVARALAAVPAVPGRFERIDEGQPFAVIVDYAHTPDGVEAVLSAARGLTGGMLRVVVGAGGDRDRDKRPKMGAVARRLADHVVVTSDNPRNEDPTTIAEAMVAGMASPPDLVELDRRAAIHHAVAGARDGDVVVIAGKGHEQGQTIAGTTLPFDDRVVAREALRARGDAGS